MLNRNFQRASLNSQGSEMARGSASRTALSAHRRSRRGAFGVRRLAAALLHLRVRVFFGQPKETESGFSVIAEKRKRRKKRPFRCTGCIHYRSGPFAYVLGFWSLSVNSPASISTAARVPADRRKPKPSSSSSIEPTQRTRPFRFASNNRPSVPVNRRPRSRAV